MIGKPNAPLRRSEGLSEAEGIRGEEWRGADSIAGSLFQITWPAFRDATADVRDSLRKNRRIPSRVYIGTEEVSPARFMTEMARVCRYFHDHGTLPLTDRISLNGEVRILPERHIASDTPELFGSWIIHREGFRAPKVMAVARLQAWTLKPAIRD